MRTPLPAAVALATCLLGVASPAAAVNDTDPRLVERSVTYVCDSELGGGDAEVTVSTYLPRTHRAGTRLASRPLDLSLAVPEELTQALRDGGVEEVSGESDDATWSIGGKVRDIRDLELPPVAVPDEGPLVLAGQGLARGLRLVTPKTYPVRLPPAFSVLLATTGGDGTPATLTCALGEGEAARIAILRVVQG